MPTITVTDAHRLCHTNSDGGWLSKKKRRVMLYLSLPILSDLLLLFPQVGVLGFVSTTTRLTTSDPCYAQQLAVATRTNKVEITSFINSLNPISSPQSSNFSNAFHDALQLFVDTPALPGESRGMAFTNLTYNYQMYAIPKKIICTIDYQTCTGIRFRTKNAVVLFSLIILYSKPVLDQGRCGYM